MQYYIGVDGGGTKTALCAVSRDFSRVLSHQTGSASWREHGVPAVVESIRRAIAAMLKEGMDGIAGVAMGLPCYGESMEGDRSLQAGISAAFPGVPHYLTNDVEVGWAGSLALEPGVNVVAGTGSIAYGQDEEGNSARSGGWDEFYSDEGSCYWMGRQMLGLFCKQADGRSPRGPLYHIVREEFGLESDIHLIDHVRTHYLQSREQVAGLQILLEKAALAGDRSARELYRDAAEELFMLAKSVKSRLEFPEAGWAVSCSGGLFKAGELIFPLFREMLEREGAEIVPPKCTPAQGAVLLACDRFHPGGAADAKRVLCAAPAVSSPRR